MRGDYISGFDTHTVGAREHVEYWIPAEELERFNEAIIGPIEVIHEFRLRHEDCEDQ